MAIEVVTPNENSLDKEQLEKNATKLILDALDEYDAEPWQMDLMKNIMDTLKKG